MPVLHEMMDSHCH